MVETEYEAIGFIYQGQIDVLLKSGPQSSFFFLNNPLELSYGHVSVAIRIQGVLGSVVEVALFRAGSRNAHLSWYMAYPTQGTKFDLGRALATLHPRTGLQPIWPSCRCHIQLLSDFADLPTDSPPELSQRKIRRVIPRETHQESSSAAASNSFGPLTQDMGRIGFACSLSRALLRDTQVLTRIYQ